MIRDEDISGGFEISHEQADKIGRLADSLDNGLAATELPFAQGVHIAGLKGLVENARDQLRALVVAVTGENPWEHHP